MRLDVCTCVRTCVCVCVRASSVIWRERRQHRIQWAWLGWLDGDLLVMRLFHDALHASKNAMFHFIWTHGASTGLREVCILKKTIILLWIWGWSGCTEEGFWFPLLSSSPVQLSKVLKILFPPNTDVFCDVVIGYRTCKNNQMFVFYNLTLFLDFYMCQIVVGGWVHRFQRTMTENVCLKKNLSQREVQVLFLSKSWKDCTGIKTFFSYLF